MSFYAYLHCRPDGTPFYVGKGNKNRLRRKNRPMNPHHTNIVKKYGVDNILIGAMECSTEEISFDLERGLIKRLRAMGVEIVNCTDGGEGCSGLRMSNEAKQKMRARKIGRKLSPEHIEKIRKSQIGKIMSPEARHKVSLARKGIKFSEEHRRKISEAKTGSNLSKEALQKIRDKVIGSKWITDGVVSKKISQGDEIPDGRRLGRPKWNKK